MLAVTVISSLIAMFAIAMAVMLLFPRSLSAISLRRLLVEPLSRWMTNGKPIHVIGTMALVLMCLAGPEMVAMMAMLGMDAAAIEVLMLVWAAAVAGSFRDVWRAMRQKTGALLSSASLRVRRGSARSPRRAKTSRGRKGGADPDPDGVLNWSFA